MKKFLVLAALVLASTQAHARNFYEANFTVDMWYSTLVSGSTVLAKDVPAKVHYSDDDQFCIIMWGNQTLNCTSKLVNTSYYYTAITVSADTLQSIASSIVSSSQATNTTISEAFLRLKATIANPTAFNYSQGFSLQIDDKEPDSFHLNFSAYQNAHQI